MPLAVQYYNGTDWQQFGLTVADAMLSNGSLANSFYSIKGSDDTLYIVAWNSAYIANSNPKIIKISKTGVITIATLLTSSGVYHNEVSFVLLSRDQQYIYAGLKANTEWNCVIPTTFVSGSEIQTTRWIETGNLTTKFAIYKDFYIWVASGNTVKIYDYTTKAEIPTSSLPNHAAPSSVVCSTENILYTISNDANNNNGIINKWVFNGVNTITRTTIVTSGTLRNIHKQLLIDPFGDLIILTNSGTASTLLKYTTGGVQVGTTLTLGGAFYNLNTDKDGNYYYSNALGTYKITANTAQGQAFTGVGTKIRGSGMTTYGNNITGYNPAVFGTQE